MSDELTTADLQTLEWWTVREVANRWRCSQDTVERHIRSGALKAMRAGGWRVHRSVIERFEANAKAGDAKYATIKKPRRMRDMVGEL